MVHERPRVAEAQPIVKWAGGKGRLLPELLARMPAAFGRYFEPFVGGGALFFRVQPLEAVLGDQNAELMNLYRCIRDQVEALIDDLQRHPYDKDYYYGMRAQDPEDMGVLARASRTVYLNRTCFNGLYRVNRRGQFNVPMGRYSDPVICQTERLRAAAGLLAEVDLRRADYAKVAADARRGDFVYFDPPYQPLSPTANFTSYTAKAFGEEDQADLARIFTELGERGVQCMLSNSDTPLIRDLYAGHQMDVVLAPRAISRSASGRGPVREVMIRNYGS